MDDELDYALALSLQDQFERERVEELNKREKKVTDDVKESEEMRARWDPKLIVDKRWELMDPHPNIHDLFVQFDAMFFDRRLVNAGVEVRWSPRMTLCAGVCSYEGRGGLCSVRLSAPLLKLRPRKDLVETLLHEMIHALLFVAERNTDHDGHGPNFCAHMKRINSLTGANITIYHTFRQEVSLYRQHWWRCSGGCRDRPPFYGWVKRAINREPSPQDPWWKNHQFSCGGTFIKVKEPEGYRKKNAKGKIKVEEKEKKGKSIESKGKGAKIKSEGKKTRSKNIVDMIGGEGEKSRGRKSTVPSGAKPFSGDGHKLATSSSSSSSFTSLADSPHDRRQKMLDAIEKRQEMARSKGLKRKSSDGGIRLSGDIRKFYLPSQSYSEEEQYKETSGSEQLSISILKKPALTSSVHGPSSATPYSNLSLYHRSFPPSQTSLPGSSYRSIGQRSNISEEEEEEEDNYRSIGRGRRSYHEIISEEEEEEEDFIVIDDSDPVVMIDEDESEKEEEEEEEEEDRGRKDEPEGMCPVCGRIGIPQDIINSHIAICLEDN